MRPASTRGSLLAVCAVLALLGVAGCNDDQPWEGKSDAPAPASVAPAATTAAGEPPMATTPADAPSPAGTTPDGDTIGTTGPGDQPADGTAPATSPTTTAADATKQDKAAMLTVRTAMSTIEGCHSGRPSYLQCDEPGELGGREETGLVFGSAPGEVKVTATPKSVRVTVRSKSGARFTVARSPGGDRFSCQSGPVAGACPDDGTWSW